MKLLNEALLKRFAEVGRQEGSKDPLVITKFFNPVGPGNWWATEYYPEDREFFGYVHISGFGCDEWGYFSQDDLESYRGKLGIGIERDCDWEELPASKVIPGFSGFGE